MCTVYLNHNLCKYGNNYLCKYGNNNVSMGLMGKTKSFCTLCYKVSSLYTNIKQTTSWWFHMKIIILLLEICSEFVSEHCHCIKLSVVSFSHMSHFPNLSVKHVMRLTRIITKPPPQKKNLVFFSTNVLYFTQYLTHVPYHFINKKVHEHDVMNVTYLLSLN